MDFEAGLGVTDIETAVPFLKDVIGPLGYDADDAFYDSMGSATFMKGSDSFAVLEYEVPRGVTCSHLRIFVSSKDDVDQAAERARKWTHHAEVKGGKDVSSEAYNTYVANINTGFGLFMQVMFKTQIPPTGAL